MNRVAKGKGTEHAWPQEEGTPTRAFSHSENCKIQARSHRSIEWSKLERGHWRAVCQCGWRITTSPIDDRVRSDPLDAKTSRHAGECEFASETDPAVLRVILKFKDSAGGEYWWVECGTCECGWQIPRYAESAAWRRTASVISRRRKPPASPAPNRSSTADGICDCMSG
jgi:hypothetical protein